MGLLGKLRQALARAEKVLPGRPGTSASQSPAAPDSAADPEPSTSRTDVEAGTSAGPATPDGPVNPSTDEASGDQGPEDEPRRLRRHTILPGETLAQIGERHGVSVQDLAELNGVDPDLVFAGQVLRVPHA